MSLRERTMGSSVVQPDRVYEYAGNWYYVSRNRTVEGPFQSRADAERSIGCAGLLDAAALARVDGLRLVSI